MSAEEFRMTMANRLKSHRKARKMSLDAAALATGVSKAMLGQIERMESAPTIATLWKIATGLNLSFSSFFVDEAEQRAPSAVFPDDPDMIVRVIFPFDPATRMEIFEVTLKNGHRQRSPAHRPGVVEHVVMVRGTMELAHEGGSRRLAAGEGYRFHADAPHEYGACSSEASFLNIICYT